MKRRRFLKTAGVTALAAGAGSGIIIPGRAQPKTLKILRPKTFVPSVDQWFLEFAATWGDQNDTEVIVDLVGENAMIELMATEVTTQQGHDVVQPWQSTAVYEDQVIDHGELYRECGRRYGKIHDIAFKNTYNPKTDKYHGFCTDYGALLTNYRQDLWQAVGRYPNTWEDVRLGGRHIRLLHESPVGIALQPQIDSETTLRAILYSFGASIQNADGRPALKSTETLAALDFFRTLYDEAMTDEVLTWDATSNNRAMLAGDICLTMNSISIVRAGENKQLPGIDNIWLAAPPQGPAGRLTPCNWASNYIIWRFAANIDAAKRFLIDYIGHTRDWVLAGKLNDMPTFPERMPDYVQRATNDPDARPSDKYKVLVEADAWTTNLGYPGYTNAAINEIYNIGLIPTMFAHAATGQMTSEEALTQADQEVRKIYDKWRALGKV